MAYYTQNLTWIAKNDGLENVSPFKYDYFEYIC